MSTNFDDLYLFIVINFKKC